MILTMQHRMYVVSFFGILFLLASWKIKYLVLVISLLTIIFLV